MKIELAGGLVVLSNMSGVLNFNILGEPRPKQSFKFAIRQLKSGGQYVSKYQPDSVEADTFDILSQIVNQLPHGHIPWTGGVMVQIQYLFSPPKTFTKTKMLELQSGAKLYKTTKPDLDNLEKMLFDAMQTRIYINDSQICSRFSEKIYSLIPGIKVSLKHLPNEK